MQKSVHLGFPGNEVGYELLAVGFVYGEFVVILLANRSILGICFRKFRLRGKQTNSMSLVLPFVAMVLLFRAFCEKKLM